MKKHKKNPVASFYDGEVDFCAAMYQRENLESNDYYPANYFRLQILVNRIAQSGKKRVYEVGVGEGTPLIALAQMGCEVAGCDISEVMVSSAKKNFKKANLNPDLIHWGDIEDSATIASQLGEGKYDIVVAAGVLPHIARDSLFYKNIAMLLNPGGKVFIEFRNKLFSLFTMNRYTKEFILDDLLKDVDATLKKHVEKEIDRRLATELPKKRSGYDDILSKFHNPFELSEDLAQHGFTNMQFHWYHYHAMPPMLESKEPKLFRKESMKLEHEQSWRGFFLCSAGLVEADLENI